VTDYFRCFRTSHWGSSIFEAEARLSISRHAWHTKALRSLRYATLPNYQASRCTTTCALTNFIVSVTPSPSLSPVHQANFTKPLIFSRNNGQFTAGLLKQSQDHTIYSQYIEHSIGARVAYAFQMGSGESKWQHVLAFNAVNRDIIISPTVDSKYAVDH
jgi:hypothetical protein